MKSRKQATSNEVFSGVAWMFSERMATQLISFAISVILARLLIPSDYGLVAITLIFLAIADAIVTSGFSAPLIQKKDADETDFSTMFYCCLMVATVIYITLYIFAPLISSFFKEPELVTVLRVFSLRVPISVLGAIQYAYVSRHMLFRRFFWSSSIGTVVSGIVGVALAYAGFGTWALIGQYFTDLIVDALILLCTVPWHPTLRFSWSSAKSLMRFGWKVLAVDLSGTLFDQFRSLAIGRTYTSADLAYYEKGRQPPEIIVYNLTTAVTSVLFPAMSNESDDLIRVRQMCRRCMQMLSFLVTPLLFGLAAVAGELIQVMYTERWIACVPYLQLLCIGFSSRVIGKVPMQTLKALGRSDVMLRLELIKRPMFVLLVIVGASISPLAVAGAMCVYEFYEMVVNLWQMRRYVDYGFVAQFSDVAPSFALSALMAIVTYSIYIPVESLLLILIVKVIIAIFMYVSLAWILHLEPFYYAKELILTRLFNNDIN